MKTFMKLVRKYGIGFILSTATLDGYRRQIMNDRNNNILDSINEEIKNFEGRSRFRFGCHVNSFNI